MTSAASESTDLLRHIAGATGMPFPNLVYRVLAKRPSRLEICWQRVAPGLRVVGAGTLRRHMLGTALSDGHTPLKPDSSLREREILRALADTYDRGNSCNLVLVTLLRRGCPGGAASILVPDSPSIESAYDPPLLPPMRRLDAMSPSARALVLRPSMIVDPTGSVVPSLFRHLAEELPLLTKVDAVVRDAQETGELDRRARIVLARARDAVWRWPLAVEAVADQSTQAILASFEWAIPRMLAVSSLLRDAVVGSHGFAPSSVTAP